GQGFFVIGKIGSGGTVTFNNSQREFVKEDDASFSQTTYRIPTTPKIANHWTYTSTAPIQKDMHKKVHLGFNFYNQSFHRQVLLAFMDEKANNEMNDGYDAVNIDDSPSDMYLLNGENELAIQGEGYFDEEASYPIGVRIESAGKVSFTIDTLENFDESQNIFIHDNETDTYHTIKNTSYEVEIPEGTFNERFSLRFTDKSLAVKNPVYDNAITVFFTRSNNVLNIKNSTNDNTVLSASLYNIQGRLISKWDVKEKEQTNIKIPIQDKTSAVYIVKLKTTKGNISKKIIVK
ncbi:MAG: T9SS type A sorting domain-containing protein, partial [Flavobacterium sp.]|nr:T9SS type A sorting domain-containing protein [Flavobacterium sp.]